VQFISGDFPGYPLRNPEPIFHYPRIPGLFVQKTKLNYFIYFLTYIYLIVFLFIYRRLYFQTVQYKKKHLLTFSENLEMY